MKKLATIASAIALGFALQACAPQAESVASTAASAPAPAQISGPALWKVADEDTTVYLFGTVHALPQGIDWYGGAIEQALGSSQVFVTEIPLDAMSGPAVQQSLAAKAMLPEGKSLRELLSDEQRATYEAGLEKVGLPAAAFDRFEPWFAAINLSLIPLLKKGYTPETGVEKGLSTRADGKNFEALETVDEQLEVFDGMPMDTQIRYLVKIADNVDQVSVTMDQLVAEWIEGDVETLGELLTRDYDDPVLFERLLYMRNANWADWIDDRMDEPGSVFMAVGAGHLAGEKSVQAYLATRGLTVERVQ